MDQIRASSKEESPSDTVKGHKEPPEKVGDTIRQTASMVVTTLGAVDESDIAFRINLRVKVSDESLQAPFVSNWRDIITAVLTDQLPCIGMYS